MKNQSLIPSSTHKKSKNKLITNYSNNFSEKYSKFTKEKLFSSTPKKASMSSSGVLSPRTAIQSKQSKDKRRQESPYARSQKININMEIKNLNIYKYLNENNSNGPVQKKKKLHKKTISCLKKSPEKEASKIQAAHQSQEDKKIQKQSINHFKHQKAKSQQNLKLPPEGWSNLLTKFGKKSTKNAEIGKKKQTVDQIVTKYAHCNRCGYCPQKKNKTNQDTYLCLQNFMKRGRYLFGVCDGHGVNGHYVSEFIREILPENIEYFFLKNKNYRKNIKINVETSIKQAFEKTSSNLIESGIDTMFSGTTTCIVYIDSHDLFCANLGDSRAVLFSKSASEQQNWTSHDLSTDHKAQDKRQALRIEMNGGRVFPYRDQDGQQMGPFRIWLKDQNLPGLAMTRSFGDFVASTVGVIDEPQITYHEIKKQDRFLVIATDGLWEFITKEQVLNAVGPAFIRNDPQSAVKDLEKMAVEAWQREDESIDDITILVIFFKYY